MTDAEEGPREWGARPSLGRWWRAQRPTLRVTLVLVPGCLLIFAAIAAGHLWHLSSQWTGDILGRGPGDRPQYASPWRLWVLEGLAVGMAILLGSVIAHGAMAPVQRRYSTPRLDVALLVLAGLVLGLGPLAVPLLDPETCASQSCLEPARVVMLNRARVAHEQPLAGHYVGLLAPETGLPPLASQGQWDAMLDRGNAAIIAAPYRLHMLSHPWAPLTQRLAYLVATGVLVGWTLLALARRPGGLTEGWRAAARVGPPLVLALGLLAASETVQILMTSHRPLQVPAVDPERLPFSLSMSLLEISQRSWWDLQMMAFMQAWRHAVTLSAIAWAMAFWVLVPQASVRHLKDKAEAF